MSDSQLIIGWVNPLRFIEAEQPELSPSKQPPTFESLAGYLAKPGTDVSLPSFVARYNELTKLDCRLVFAPADGRILDKLVWPLKHAKVSFMLGNLLGTISMCGTAAEMLAILQFEMAEFVVGGRKATDEDQKALFGSTFERLGQERRVAILRTLGLIDDATRICFDHIREVRRKYLHFWSKDHGSIENDATAVYGDAITLVVGLIGQDIQDGRLKLNEPFVKYLKSRGLVMSPGEAESEGSKRGLTS